VVPYGAKSDDAIYCTIARKSINGHNKRNLGTAVYFPVVIDDPTLLGLLLRALMAGLVAYKSPEGKRMVVMSDKFR